MRILILGSEGFIGRNCVAEFIRQGYEVWGADLFEQPSLPYRYTKISRLSPELDELLQAAPFDSIINAAGSGNVPYSMLHPLIDFEANCLDTIRLLEAIRRFCPSCKYIHLSSAAVYGNPEQLPVKETAAGKPLSAYGFHKLISEQVCQEYTQLYQVKTAVVRPFSVYGPGLKKQLFWDVYQKIRNSEGKPVTLYGTGKESRDFIYISDLVAVIHLIIQKGNMVAEVYNAGQGKETTIEEAMRLYFRALGNPLSFEFNGVVRAGDPLNWCADISNLQSLGYTPSVSLDQGLEHLANWITSVHS